MNFIECPICFKKFKNLHTHVFYKHGLSTETFREQFPNFGNMQNVNVVVKKVCPYCNDGKLYGNPGLSVHIAYKHKGVKRGDPNNKTKHDFIAKEGYTCPICQKVKKNLSQHIEMTHNMQWDTFTSTYGWTENKTFFSTSHKENLSKNKKNFYNTPAGVELRKISSVKFTGSNNPGCLESSRKKASINMTNRLQRQNEGDNLNNINGYGILVYYRGKVLRSLQEFEVVLFLEKHNIPYEYESKTITYIDPTNRERKYLIDFCINGNFFEIKEDSLVKNYLEETKYAQAKKVIESEGNAYHIMSPKQLAEYFGKDKMTPFAFKQKCKELLEKDCVKFRKNSTTHNYSFFKQLDTNYLTNKNFICR